VHSLQSALDALRNYRPEFAPRTGFVWPVIDDQVTSDDKGETRAQPTAPGGMVGDESEVNSTQKQPKRERKQENLALMYNAMRTTAAYMKGSYSSKLNETLIGLSETPLEPNSPSSGPPESSMPVDTPGTIASSQATGEIQAKEPAPLIVKKKKRSKLYINRVERFSSDKFRGHPSSNACSPNAFITSSQVTVLIQHGTFSKVCYISHTPDQSSARQMFSWSNHKDATTPSIATLIRQLNLTYV
jgi:hypothetical protein